MFKKLLLFSISSAILLPTVTLGLLVWGILDSSSWMRAKLSSLFEISFTEPVKLNRKVIVHKIQGINELSTVEMTFETVIPVSQERKLGELTIGKSKLLYLAYGQVQAGIVLSALNADDINIQQDHITINLPYPVIVNNKLDLDKSEVYHFDRGFLNLGPNSGFDLEKIAQQKTEQKFITLACQNGILDEAKEKSQVFIEELFEMSSNREVTVSFDQPNSPTCIPE
jgi:hypothetical protein